MRSLLASGADVVTACTSCMAAIKHDYPKWLRETEAAALTERTHDVMEYLVRHWEGGTPPFEPVELSLAYHAPCHLVVLGDELIDRRLALLRAIPGLTVTRVDRGCCGMGGTFGMKCRNYQMSMEIGAALFAALNKLKPDMVISECPTCRSQIAHGTGLPVTDPVMIIRRALRTVNSGGGESSWCPRISVTNFGLWTLDVALRAKPALRGRQLYGQNHLGSNQMCGLPDV